MGYDAPKQPKSKKKQKQGYTSKKSASLSKNRTEQNRHKNVFQPSRRFRPFFPSFLPNKGLAKHPGWINVYS
jgi:hypothetical protein